MKRNFLLVVVVVAAALGAAVVPATVVAQGGQNATGAAEDAANATNVHVVNRNLGGAKLISWEYLGEGTFRLRMASSTVQQVAMSDVSGQMGEFSEGSGSKTFTYEPTTQQIGPGVETFEYSATVVDAAAAMSISDDRTVGFRSAAIETGGRPPVEWGTVQALLAIAVAGTAWGTYRQVRKRREDERKDAERVV